MFDRLCPLKDAARDAPKRNAFDSTTFQELDKLADDFARDLALSGIGPGDRIAVFHPPCVELAALFFAAWRMGASISPLSLRIPPSQIEAHLIRLDAKLFINCFPIGQQIRHTHFAPTPFPAAFLFTSGSTSLPKIAVLSISSLLSNAESAARWLDLREDDKWLLNLPLYHVGGIGILLRCVLSRASAVLNGRDPTITHISAVPTQLYRATPVYKKLRCLLIGGAPIHSYPERLPCYLSYGLTEMGSLVACGFRSLQLFPLPGREVRLSEQGEVEVRGSCLFEGYWEKGKIHHSRNSDGWFPTGDLGRLYGAQSGFVNSDSARQSRIDPHEEDHASMRQGASEDEKSEIKPMQSKTSFSNCLGRSSDRLSILGRKDWQFISGGENIQPEEIEEALLALPEVLEAAVIPIADDAFGMRPAAFIHSSDPSFDIERMKKALSSRLPKFKIPLTLFFLDELPKNGLKTNRKRLFEIAHKKV